MWQSMTADCLDCHRLHNDEAATYMMVIYEND